MNRRREYDALRVFSMLGVIYLHTAAGALRESTGALWHFSNLVSSLATVAVPLFFMLSGALLLSSGRTESVSALFLHRLPKVLVPLALWSAISLAIWGFRDGFSSILPKLLALLNTPVLVPYWFLYALVPMYLLSPLLKKMADGLTDAHWNYLVALWLVLTVLLRTLRAFLPVESPVRTVFTIHWTLNLDVVGGYLGYFLLGARLDRLRRLPPRPALWCAGLAAFLIIALGTLADWRRTGAYDERFKNYLYLFAAVLAVSLFLLARSYLGGKPSGRGLILCSGLSFGVYLAHPLAIKLWAELWLHFTGGGMSSPGQQILFFGLVTLTCLFGMLLAASLKPLCFPLTGQPFSAACRESNLFALFRRGPIDKP